MLRKVTFVFTHGVTCLSHTRNQLLTGKTEFLGIEEVTNLSMISLYNKTKKNCKRKIQDLVK